MIVVLSLNTAVDRIMVVPNFHAGEVYRAEASRAYAGGKGINVARVVRQLGSPVRIVGPLGGLSAPFIRDECERMGIEGCWVPIENETRTCVIVADPEGGQTVLNEPGPEIKAEEVERLTAAIRSATAPSDLLCISGSAPPGVLDGFYAEVVAEQERKGVRVLVDISGPALRLAWEARPWAVKPNLAEARAAFRTDEDGPTVARRLAEKAEHVLVTLGAEGVLHATDDQVALYRPPSVPVVNAVGSGDALAAGFLVVIKSGMSAEEALRLGVACGAANAMRLEPGVGSRNDVELLKLATSSPQIGTDCPA
jgi:tagatose 6-phosphate kinase